jgi:hypothetical protein
MYYSKLTLNEYEEKQKSHIPLGFIDVCNPLGWSYQTINGDQSKYPQNKVLIEGPISNL